MVGGLICLECWPNREAAAKSRALLIHPPSFILHPLAVLRPSSFVRTVLLALILGGAAGPSGAVTAAPAASPAPAAPTAGAQPLPVINRSLSIDQAVALALKYNPSILEGQEDVAAAGARVDTAAARGKPSLSASLFGSKSSWSNIITTPADTPPVNLMGIPPGAFIDQNVMAMFPLYTGGRVAAAVRGARAEHFASVEDRAASQQDVALEARIAYRRVLYQDALVKAQQQNLTAAKEQLRLDNERYAVGKLAEFTLYRDRTLVATSEQDVTNAVRDQEQAIYALETVLGVSLQSNLTLTGALSATPPSVPAQPASPPASAPGGPAPAVSPAPTGTTPPPSAPAVPAPPASMAPVESAAMAPATQAALSALIATAMRRRPEMQAASARIAAAAAILSGSRAESQPQLNLMGMGDATHGDQSLHNGLNYTVGVALGIPIFEGGALSSARREARAGLAKARAEEQAVRLGINRDVADALSNQRAARQNLATSLVGLAQAQEDYNVEQIRFANGKGIQLELLDALAALTTARTQVARAQFELAAANDQLLRSTGTILPPPPTGGHVTPRP